MKELRIFISSPGDVSEERERARQVIQGLRRRYARHFDLKPVLWEEMPLQPDMSFQQGIDMVFSKERGVDIAIFILWSRMGSPTGPLILKDDGSTYLSGTEREYDLMMTARRQSRESTGTPRPDVLVYIRSDEPSFDERLRGRSTDEKTVVLAQKKLVESFIKEEFQDQTTKLNVGAYHRFDRPTTFSQRLRQHLSELLDERAGGMAEAVWDPERQGPPFLGLNAFQPQHADVFFGREDEIVEIHHILREQARNGSAFVLLSGASGSGKSSLARAGVLPAVIENELDEQVTAWRYAIVAPSGLAPDPIKALVQQLASESVLPELREDAAATDDFCEVLGRHPADALALRFKPALRRAAGKAGGEVRLLLVLDQLEELFAAVMTAAARAQFLALIEAFARSGSVWVVATVRSDFNAQMQGEPALVRLKAGLGTVDVLPPRSDALRRLIEEPARLAGLRFQERDGISLANRILRDAACGPELLPLVEYVLRELYEKRTDNGELTFVAYEALGGVEGALAKRAETIFLNLPTEAKECLGAVLKSLVTLGHSSEEASGNAAEAEHLVRQWAALASFPPGHPSRALVDAFVQERLFHTARNPQTGEASFTLAHESLLRVWPTASAWADYNRDFLRTRARIAARQQEQSPLLEGDPLFDAARAYFARDPDGFTAAQRGYIEASIRQVEAAQRRSKRRRQWVLLGLCILTLVSIVGGLLAWRETLVARTNENDAKAAEGRADDKARKLANRLRQAASFDWETAKLDFIQFGNRSGWVNSTGVHRPK